MSLSSEGKIAISKFTGQPKWLRKSVMMTATAAMEANERGEITKTVKHFNWIGIRELQAKLDEYSEWVRLFGWLVERRKWRCILEIPFIKMQTLRNNNNDNNNRFELDLSSDYVSGSTAKIYIYFRDCEHECECEYINYGYEPEKEFMKKIKNWNRNRNVNCSMLFRRWHSSEKISKKIQNRKHAIALKSNWHKSQQTMWWWVLCKFHFHFRFSFFFSIYFLSILPFPFTIMHLQFHKMPQRLECFQVRWKYKFFLFFFLELEWMDSIEYIKTNVISANDISLSQSPRLSIIQYNVFICIQSF